MAMKIMYSYDENAPFEFWANRWVKHKSVGMSFLYNRALKSQVEHLINAVGDIPVKDIMPMQLNDLKAVSDDRHGFFIFHSIV